MYVRVCERERVKEREKITFGSQFFFFFYCEGGSVSPVSAVLHTPLAFSILCPPSSMGVLECTEHASASAFLSGFQAWTAFVRLSWCAFPLQNHLPGPGVVILEPCTQDESEGKMGAQIAFKIKFISQ